MKNLETGVKGLCKRLSTYVKRETAIFFFCTLIGLLSGCSKIAFMSFRDGGWGEIYTMRSNGSRKKRITKHPAHDACPALSPDRKRIVFMSRRDGFDKLYIKDKGGSLEKFTDYPAYNPAWSPNGEWVVFTSMKYGNMEICKKRSDGSEEVRLTHHPGYDGHPCWSPDGEWIGYTSERDRNFEIYKMKDDGSAKTRLTRNKHYDAHPCWSCNDEIAFTSNRDKNFEIYKMEPDGSNQVNLTRNPAYDAWPSWSPRGRRFTFQSSREGESWQIFKAKANGSNVKKLTNNPFHDMQASWR